MIKDDLLTVNEFSRPGKLIKSVMKLVVHYVQNPETTAKQNRDFFELRKTGDYGYGSAHYIVDDKEIIRCIPDREMAYHVGSKYYTPYGLEISSYPNARTLGIEFCHDDIMGMPTLETYNNLVELLAYLCKDYSLNPINDICTHFDVTGKMCPLYYVNNKDKMEQLKLDVKRRMV